MEIRLCWYENKNGSNAVLRFDKSFDGGARNHSCIGYDDLYYRNNLYKLHLMNEQVFNDK